MLDAIQRTGDRAWPIIPRLVAGVPLLIRGLVHATGSPSVGALGEAAGLPAAGALGVVVPIVEMAAALMLIAGWLTRPGAVLGALAMALAIMIHVLIPGDRWPQPFGGGVGPEPVAPFLMAWLILACCMAAVIVGGGRWSLDRRQLAARAASRGGGLDGLGDRTPRAPKRKRNEAAPPDGGSVW